MTGRTSFKTWLFTLCLCLGAGIARAADPLQTQMSLDGGLEVDLLRAKAQNNILTIVAAYRNNGSGKAQLEYPVSEVYYIDDQAQKKYHVLKDDQGKWIAAPVNNHGNIGVVGRDWGLDIPPGGKQVVWFKFPAPEETASSITLSLPNVTPFDPVTISR